MFLLPKLEALPIELFEEITSYLSPSDFLPLRQTCRTISAAIESQFLEAFFSRRSHLFSLRSLEVLADIARQPMLINELKELRLVLVWPSVRLVPQQRRKPVREILDQQQGLVQLQGPQLLAEIFSAIATRPRALALELQLTDDCSELSESETYGGHHLRRLLGLDGPELQTTDGRKIFNAGSSCLKENMVSVLHALTETENLNLRSLRIVAESDADHDNDPADFRFLSEPHSLADKMLFSHLTQLQVDFGRVYFPLSNLSDKHGDFCEMLANAIRLEALDLSGYGGWTSNSWHDGGFFKRLAESLSPNAPVRRLALSWFDVEEKDLIAVLDSRLARLERATFKELTLGKDEVWHKVLSMIRTRGLKLDWLGICRVRCDDEEIAEPQDRLRQPVLAIVDQDGESGVTDEFEFCEKEEILTGLKMLIDEGEYVME